MVCVAGETGALGLRHRWADENGAAPLPDDRGEAVSRTNPICVCCGYCECCGC
jgi:hypothetical protein